jgi:ATP-dependent Lhr-like helicase
MELRGEIRGGRFVGGFAGEQFALPSAVELLRQTRRQGPHTPITVHPSDPLNFQGILTPLPSQSPVDQRQPALVG